MTQTLIDSLHVTLALYFSLELTNSHHGQTDHELGAWNHGEPLGYLNYSVFEGQIHIHHVFVHPDHRRRGIATAMYQRLQQEYPGQEIRRFGDVSTDSGLAFRSSLNCAQVVQHGGDL